MTYKEYLASPEEMARYDILDGWKVYRLYGEEQLTNPTIRHQKIERNIARVFEDYESGTWAAVAIISPCDVLIRERPARTRQPDVLLISKSRLADRDIDDPEPLSPAPELVVEILSKNEKQRAVDEKIADYIAAGVLEIWIVRSVDQTVERLLVQDEALKAKKNISDRGQPGVGCILRACSCGSRHLSDIRKSEWKSLRNCQVSRRRWTG